MLVAYYDLAHSPPTYDIVAFLLAIERERMRRGEDEIDLRIIPGPSSGFRRDGLWPHDIAERVKMRDKVAVPMAKMLPGCRVTVEKDRPQFPTIGSIGFATRLYGLRLQVECMRQGICPLRAPGAWAPHPRLVTITLRECEHWPLRNSNRQAWAAAARIIAGRGWVVTIIRDGRHAAESLVEGIETAALAATYLPARARLYAMAACNMFVSNGPAWFAMALNAPVLMLKPVVHGSHVFSSRYLAAAGIPEGQSVPGAPRNQRIVWADDTEANILDTFDAFAG